MLLKHSAKRPLAPRYSIETMEGPHERPKAKANNTLPRPKRKLSYSTSYKWLP
ncbi:hypothetical protein PSPO01_15158 [Paraphaeosphaeria sporulosa]